MSKKATQGANKNNNMKSLQIEIPEEAMQMKNMTAESQLKSARAYPSSYNNSITGTS